MKHAFSRLFSLLKSLGPGLVAGASDNDPTTVGTLSVVGATTGFALSWLIICIAPMLIVAQLAASQVGLATKGGMQELVRKRYRRSWALLLLASLLAVNLITLGADLEAGTAAIALILPVPVRIIGLPFAVILFVLLLIGSFDEVQSWLKYVLLVFVAYVAAAFLSHPDWGGVARATIPHLRLNKIYVEAVLAVLGTTLTSYCYVWEEEEQAEAELPYGNLRTVRIDAVVGIVVAVLVFWFIVITTGATLGVHHEQVETAQQAASALAPVAGRLAGYLFGAGLLASAVIAVPVLGLVSARLVCEERSWPRGLSNKPRQAPAFYMLLGGSLLIGVVVSFIGIPSITLLFWASIAGGLGTPISLAFLLLIARDRKVMGSRRIPGGLAVAGWVVAILVTAAGLAFLASQLL